MVALGASIRYKIYIDHNKIWMFIILNIFKLCLIVSMFCDYHCVGNYLIEEIQGMIVVLCLIAYAVGVLLETVNIVR